MGRPPLPVGTFANISVREVAPGRHRARCRFRDYDGQVRYVVRFGSSESAAERNLKVAMVDRVAAAGAADLTRNSKVTDLSVSYTHLRAHETDSYLVCRLLLEKKKNKKT